MFLTFFLSLVLAADDKVTVLSCKLLDDGNVKIATSFDNDADAWAQFTDSYGSIGWGKIHIWTNPESESYNQMYCAGFADAYLTRDRIQEYFYLYKEMQLGDKNGKWHINWTNWFSQNINYMRRMTVHPVDDYWKRTALILAQFDGMVQGYANASKPGDLPISELDFWIMQSAGDLDDLAEVFQVGSRDPELTLKCTGLIKILDDYSDVYFAQDTWSDYRELHSYLKEYNLNVPEFKSHRVQVSTRTGHMPSVDDFWTNDKGLLVLETTMHNFNETLYKLYVKPESVLTWIRSYHATFSSDNGKEWTENFIRENSGTYNNEYIVLDTKKFKKGEKPQDDFLWMIEQYPGIYRSQDITQELLEKKYFASVNAPWFEDLFEIADYPGQQKREPQKAAFWSYYDQPRYEVIKRDAGKISNYEDFKRFMRYNNYTEDDILSRVVNPVDNSTFEEPAQGILSRYDLRPETGTPYGAQNNFGGLDAKAARISSFMANQSFDAICSPEYDFNEPWNFEKWNQKRPDKKISYDGLATEYKFPWTEFYPIDYCDLYGGNDKETCINIPGCGYCIYEQKCMMGGKDEPSDSLNLKCADGWTKKEAEKAYALPLIVSVTIIIVVFVTAVFLSAFLPQCQRRVQYKNF